MNQPSPTSHMLPYLAVIQIDNPYARSHRFWVPLFLVWFVLLLLMPFLLLILLAVCFLLRINFFRAISVPFGILAALPGTSVEVQHQANHIQVRVY